MENRLLTVRETARYRIPGREVSGDKVSEALYAITYRRLQPEEVSHFIKSTLPHTVACLGILKQLKLAEVTSDGGFQAAQEIAYDFKAMKPEHRPIIFVRYLMRYRPFLGFVAMIHKGYAPMEAAAKVNVIYQLSTTDHYVERNFLSLGLYAGLLRRANGTIALSREVEVEELPPDYIERLREATLGEVQARLFVRESLGDEAYEQLRDPLVEDVVHALLEFRRDPKDAIVSVGRAVEDFLRSLATQRGSRDYSLCNGIIEIANNMRGENPPLLLPGHMACTDFIGKLRNPGGGHGIDKETLERWGISPEVALQAILVALSCIRSVHAFAFAAHQVL